MAKNLPDIEYTTSNDSNVIPIVDSSRSMYQIPLYKDSDYFANIESYVNFIKGCERAVRTNDRYKKYIYYVKKRKPSIQNGSVIFSFVYQIYVFSTFITQ